MPFFSVVIPLYNKQNYITATLQSVLSQTFTDFEVVIINDVSTDESLKVATTVKDSRIRIINHEKNSGLSASRNTGIKNAHAEYVAFLDADDIWKPDFLKEIHNLIVNYPEADLFATKYEEIYPSNVGVIPSFSIGSGIVDNFFLRNLNKTIYCPSGLCVKKSTFETIGLYDEKISMGEDVDFNIRAHLKYRMAYCNKPLVEYTMYSENQIMHSSLSGKTIVDHDYYEKANPGNKELKKYLDFHRYTMAKRYKLAGDMATYKKMVKAIHLANLNYKQQILLYAPVFALKLIKMIKSKLIKKGINPTTY